MQVQRRMQMRALITGCTGQDGRLLACYLLDKGYKVYGLIRGQHNPKRQLVDPNVELIEGDLTDFGSLVNAIDKADPHEIYNLGAISHVGVSFKQPETTANVTGLGCLRLLEAIKQAGLTGYTRFYQASTSELFGEVRETPQSELTPFHPRSPYAVAKAFAHHTTINYRESYGMHASCGILFNHESEIRGYEFVTRKVTQAAARIKLRLQDKISLGTLDTYRDWGYANDYVEAMWLMLQQDKPDDYVIATGQVWSIRDLLSHAFAAADVPNWPDYVYLDDKFKRPSEVNYLQGDAHKADLYLGWKPKVQFPEMIYRMVQNDIEIESKNVS